MRQGPTRSSRSSVPSAATRKCDGVTSSTTMDQWDRLLCLESSGGGGAVSGTSGTSTMTMLRSLPAQRGGDMCHKPRASTSTSNVSLPAAQQHTSSSPPPALPDPSNPDGLSHLMRPVKATTTTTTAALTTPPPPSHVVAPSSPAQTTTATTRTYSIPPPLVLLRGGGSSKSGGAENPIKPAETVHPSASTSAFVDAAATAFRSPQERISDALLGFQTSRDADRLVHALRSDPLTWSLLKERLASSLARLENRRGGVEESRSRSEKTSPAATVDASLQSTMHSAGVDKSTAATSTGFFVSAAEAHAEKTSTYTQSTGDVATDGELSSGRCAPVPHHHHHHHRSSRSTCSTVSSVLSSRRSSELNYSLSEYHA